MALRARLLCLAVAFALAAAVLHAQQADPQGGNPGGGRGGGRGGGQGPGPLIDPAQMPGGPGGRGRGGQPRDNQAAPKGTAKINGRVVAAESGNPLRRAQIRLTAAEIRVNRVATTDNDGRYEFADLAAGRYRLQINKVGYVALEYGQARPFEAGKPLDIADGQTLDKIDFSLPRGSVIAGRVTDEFGDPVADASVQAMRYQFVNGQRQLVTAGRPGTSDDIGQYRIFGLMPGDYIVRATVRDNSIVTAVFGGGAGAEDPSGYPTTYYPGTTDVGQAQAVTVALGQELSSVYFSLVPARLARISGTVIDSQGHALSAAVVLVRPARGGGGGGAFNIGGANQVRADGGFAINNVPPGDYTLDVQQRPRDLANLGTSQLEFASVPITVSGSDLTGLSIITTTGVSVSGRVVLQGQKTQGVSLRGIQVAAVSPSGTASLMGLAGRALGGGRINNDEGTFELRGLAGLQMINVSNIPAGWVLKSITLEGEDIADTPFDFRSGRSLTGLVVTLTDKITDLAGTVSDSRGQAVKDYVVVIFPDEEKLWGGQSRYIKTARPNQDAAFDIKGLPPAKYLAVAVDSLETGSQSDPAVLQRLRPLAKSFTVADDVRTQTLKLELSAPR
jgi:protocatechuate 3,4-dioxygenase beta subunit